ncbi:DUF3109 family protein [Neolewinella antarctica]|uniref:DUF3109 family protein n=1 Tax=Neolewinella antarctica TaxID=442734 RepID=A0ABX0XBE6_9BACT|nr:DUF3109 family protein [Neolewinella antarctica]NJC26301.1 hypothetical protein [Neolewinella antarctica]
MYLIQGIFVTEDVTNEQFACNLTACKGACCWEGDFGAPLEESELAELESVYDKVAENMTPLGIAAVAARGKYTENPETEGHDTTLVDGGACAYMGKTDGGIAFCAIEKTYNEGKISWKKPISCHLYPIRVASKPEANFEALNYDRWDICSAACTKGAREKIRVYEFAKPALIRKYGEEWYEELEAAVASGF